MLESNKYKLKLFIGILLFLGFESQSQVLDNMGMLNLNYLKYGNELPEELLSERTVVLVNDEIGSGGSKKSGTISWKAFSGRFHPTFRMLGIDPVAYYNLDLVLSGVSITGSFANDIKNRAISHAIVIEREKTAGNDTLFSLTISTLSDKDLFFAAGQPAFQIQHNSLKSLLQQLIRVVSASGVPRTNFLILEHPEFFSETRMFAKGRFEKFNPDLKLDKLAVPLFEERVPPQNIPPGMSREEVNQKIALENNQVSEANRRMQEILNAYPFDYEPVSYKDGEAAWKRTGNHFILLNIHGKASTVRDFLGYETVEDQPTFTSTRVIEGEAVTQEIDKNQQVYKYYIQHINSGEIYLGTHWDVATTWEQALENFIYNLRASFPNQ